MLTIKAGETAIRVQTEHLVTTADHFHQAAVQMGQSLVLATLDNRVADFHGADFSAELIKKATGVIQGTVGLGHGLKLVVRRRIIRQRHQGRT